MTDVVYVLVYDTDSDSSLSVVKLSEYVLPFRAGGAGKDFKALVCLAEYLGMDARRTWRIFDVGEDFPLELLPMYGDWTAEKVAPICDRFAPVSNDGKVYGYFLRRRGE